MLGLLEHERDSDTNGSIGAAQHAAGAPQRARDLRLTPTVRASE